MVDSSFYEKKKMLWIWRGEPKHVEKKIASRLKEKDSLKLIFSVLFSLTNMCIMGLLFLARKTPMHS